MRHIPYKEFITESKINEASKFTIDAWSADDSSKIVAFLDEDGIEYTKKGPKITIKLNRKSLKAATIMSHIANKIGAKFEESVQSDIESIEERKSLQKYLSKKAKKYIHGKNPLIRRLAGKTPKDDDYDDYDDVDEDLFTKVIRRIGKKKIAKQIVNKQDITNKAKKTAIVKAYSKQKKKLTNKADHAKKTTTSSSKKSK